MKFSEFYLDNIKINSEYTPKQSRVETFNKNNIHLNSKSVMVIFKRKFKIDGLLSSIHKLLTFLRPFCNGFIFYFHKI